MTGIQLVTTILYGLVPLHVIAIVRVCRCLPFSDNLCCDPWGGWLAFVIALIFIGILTIHIGDLARIFGCLVGLRDPVTAITFVATGTSLPDLFASKTAAVQENMLITRLAM